MKIVLFIILIAFVSTGCSQRKKESMHGIATENVSPATVGKVSYLTTADFKQKVMDYEAHPQQWTFAGKRPAVIDFYATWCGPCKMMSPIVELMAQKYAGKVDFYKVDIDKEQELADVFGIQSIPTFLFIPMKGNPSAQMGMIEKEEFEKLVSEINK